MPMPSDTPDVGITTQDPNIDGFLVILTPQAMSDPTGTARELQAYAKEPGKPVLASWMAGRRSNRRADPQSRKNPDIRVSRCRRASIQLMWRSIRIFRRSTRPQACRRAERRGKGPETAEAIIAKARKVEPY